MKKIKPKKEKPKAEESLAPTKAEVPKFNFGGLPERDLKKNLGC